MRVLLRDLAPGQEYAIKFRSNNGEETSEWSQVQRFVTTDDIIAPSQPKNLSWYDSGSSFIGQWDKVTTQATVPPTDLKDFRYYRCNITDGVKAVDVTVTNEYLAFSKEANIAAFGTFKNALTLRVYCTDNTYNESVPAVATANPLNPPVPSTPVLSQYFGSLMGEWNGKDASGSNMPANIDYLEVHVGTANNFSASASTLFARLYPNSSQQTQRVLLTGLTNGTTYYIRYVAVNLANRKSNPSAISNGVVKTNLTGLDIQPNGIGTDQINFTARDLGGANAFYGTTQPQVGTNGVTVIKTGDVWYDTNVGANGGKTYRYNGTNFVEDASIGVISGKKIITNTLTADAVGTNLLITAKANIGNAIIDEAHIDYLSAADITTGILKSNFNVNYGGVSQPAFSFDMNGNAILNNITVNGMLTVGSSTNTAAVNSAFALKSYNYVSGQSGWAIKGDGTVEFSSGIFRGRVQTATSGQRVEIGFTTNGRVGGLDLYNDNNSRFYITNAYQVNTGVPGFILGLGDPWNYYGTTDVSQRWNSFEMVGDSAVWLSQDNHYHQFDTNGFWSINEAVGAHGHKVMKNRVLMGKDTMFLNDSTENDRVSFDTSGTYISMPATGWNFYLNARNGDGSTWQPYMYTAGNKHTWKSINQNARMELAPGGGFNSPFLRLFSDVQGAALKAWAPNNGDVTRLEARWWDDSGFVQFAAANVNLSSDETLKEDIVVLDKSSLLSEIKKTPVSKYRRKHTPDDPSGKKGKKANINAPEEIGLIAQQAPEQIRGTASDGTLTVDLYQMASMLWGAVQELSDKIEQLENQNKKGKK